MENDSKVHALIWTTARYAPLYGRQQGACPYMENDSKVRALIWMTARYIGYKSAIKTVTTLQRNVVQDNKTICNKGRARLATELAQDDKFSVSRGFAAAICALPTVYTKSSYMYFFNHRGTVI
jgi:hypothetical protein